MVQLSALEKEDIRYLIRKAGNGRSMLLDLSDERQERFLRKQLELAGIEPRRKPQLFRTIADAKVRHARFGAPQGEYVRTSGATQLTAVNVVTQIDTTDGQNYVAGAISSIPGNAHNVTVTLGIYDGDLNPLGDISKVEKYSDESTFSVQAAGKFTTPMPPEGRSVMSILTYQYSNDQGTYHGVMPVETHDFPKQITNLSPRDLNGDNLIKVCLYRQESDCDYRDPQWTGIVKIPVEGSIEYFANIDPIQFGPDGTPANASCTIQVVKQVQPGSPITPPAGFNFFKDPKTTVNGAVLSWNLGWLSFDRPNFNSGDYVYYIFNVVIQTGGKNAAAFITNAPPSVAPGQNPFNTLNLPPMEVVYGCLAEGTLVRLADRSWKPIENIIIGERVLSDSAGTCLTVENTVVGVEDKPMFRITDDGDNALLVTEGHPVITTEGVRLAHELQVGDKLRTETGESTITGIQEELYSGQVWNLHLVAADDSIALTDNNRTHFANGIMVGDGRMQRIYGNKVQKNADGILAKLPRQWHQDYLNWLQEQQCPNQ